MASRRGLAEEHLPLPLICDWSVLRRLPHFFVYHACHRFCKGSDFFLLVFFIHNFELNARHIALGEALAGPYLLIVPRYLGSALETISKGEDSLGCTVEVGDYITLDV